MSILSVMAQDGSAVAEADMPAVLPMLGHELRTPLTALKGHVQLMQRRLRRENGRGADLEDLERISQQVARLNHQIDLILDASRLAQHSLLLNLTPTDLGALVERIALGQPSPAARRKITVEAAASPLIGMWDGAYVGHVLFELLSNAVRFSRREGQLWVRISVASRAARVEVADQGIGVPADEREAIFEYGRRGSNAESFGGAGLGLYVARGIVQLHGGDMGVEPQLDSGSVFWFTLPL